MKYSYNVFFIILWGLFISCSSDDPAVDSNEGKDDKEDPLPDKLIGRFNSVNDYEQEEGVILTNSLVDFKEEGAWKTYTFAFSKREYSAAATQLKNGIAGIVILPTYSSGVTLAEGNKYKCYIDDIEIL